MTAISGMFLFIGTWIFGVMLIHYAVQLERRLFIRASLTTVLLLEIANFMIFLEDFQFSLLHIILYTMITQFVILTGLIFVRAWILINFSRAHEPNAGIVNIGYPYGSALASLIISGLILSLQEFAIASPLLIFSMLTLLRTLYSLRRNTSSKVAKRMFFWYASLILWLVVLVAGFALAIKIISGKISVPDVPFPSFPRPGEPPSPPATLDPSESGNPNQFRANLIEPALTVTIVAIAVFTKILLIHTLGYGNLVNSVDYYFDLWENKTPKTDSLDIESNPDGHFPLT